METPAADIPAPDAKPAKRPAAKKAAPVKKATPAKRTSRRAAAAAAFNPEPSPQPEPTRETPEPTPTANLEPDREPKQPESAEPKQPESAEPQQPESAEPAQSELTKPEEPESAKPEQPESAKPEPEPEQQPQPHLEPHQPQSAEPEQPEPAHAKATPQKARPEPWARLIADPGHAPEFLALAAVQAFGPRAQAWAERTRGSYPAADDRAVARLARQQFTRLGSLGSIFGAVAGSYAPLTLLGTAAITHAELILHVAAAYGLDPTDPERAADLLVIIRAHPTKPDAEAALASAARPAYEDGGLSGAVRRLGRMVAAQTGGWAVLRFANRYFPGTSLLAAVLTSTASAQTVAARAEAYYRGLDPAQPRVG